MQPLVLDIRQAAGKGEHGRQLWIIYAELVLRKTRSDVGMGMSAYIGVDPEADRSNDAKLRSQRIDDLELRG